MYAKLGIAGGIVLVLLLAITDCSHWKTKYLTLEVDQSRREEKAASAAIDALQAAFARRIADEEVKRVQAEKAVQAAKLAAETAQLKASQWAAAYHKALKEDPSCALWASQAVACPL